MPDEEDRITAQEARAIRMALYFGVPNPAPPEIESAQRKLKTIQAGGEHS